MLSGRVSRGWNEVEGHGGNLLYLTPITHYPMLPSFGSILLLCLPLSPCILYPLPNTTIEQVEPFTIFSSLRGYRAYFIISTRNYSASAWLFICRAHRKTIDPLTVMFVLWDLTSLTRSNGSVVEPRQARNVCVGWKRWDRNAGARNMIRFPTDEYVLVRTAITFKT